MPKSIKEAMNRGNNLLIVGFLSVLGIGVIAELFNEVDLQDKIDDTIIMLIAIIAIVWYVRGTHRYQYSWVPFILLSLGFIDKIGAIAIESGDPAAAGDEFGILPTLLALMIISAVIMVRSRRANQELEEGFGMNAPIPQTGGHAEENDVTGDMR
jgi:hypothetical protein